MICKLVAFGCDVDEVIDIDETAQASIRNRQEYFELRSVAEIMHMCHVNLITAQGR